MLTELSRLGGQLLIPRQRQAARRDEHTGLGTRASFTADLADALIDAGYEIRIDAAVKDMRDSPSEIRVPLTTTNAGKPQAGKQYIQSMGFQLP